ncbi:hypothetical protein ACRALDRAFT_1079589 [Sodiomyces alcalophilus JCM 7366]|uniref:uncharacterized protein n=1 Tax=Sodiomyces alcalophilus JCM 7366 TaxID=591952 RepID=UPI0039B591D4
MSNVTPPPYRPTEPGQPCNVCGHPRDGEKGSNPSVRITWLEHLDASAGRACPLCMLIVRGIERCLGREVVRGLGDTTLKLEFNMARMRSLQVTFKSSASVSFVISPDSPLFNHPCFTTWSPGHPVPRSTSSDESLAWVLERIRECDSTHGLCKPTSEPCLPKRVLDIGTSNRQVRLCVTEENTPGRYVCLSHRWGMPPIQQRPLRRTLSNNIESHREGIDWDGLPPTFQDAITFTRSLGIRYLWIDSLCIVQDDQDDWRREGAKMASIYSNAHLALAAAHGRDSESPMFVQTDPKFQLRPLGLSEPLLKEFGLDRTKNGHDMGIYVRRPLTHIIRHTHLRETLRQPFPLLQRGWVFQERFLSPRTLYFGPEELSWECVEHHECQCTEPPTAVQTNPQLRLANPKELHRPSVLRQLADAKGRHTVANRWTSLVEEYTALDLTFDTDIFPALSGLAKSYRSVLDSRYCAGLWEDFLHEGLLWHVNRATEDWAQAQWPGDTWRAPSWSWAAVKGTVTFTPTNISPLQEKCEVLEIDCSLAGPDSTGELTRGHLVLRGVMVPTRLEYVDKAKGSSRSPQSLFTLATMKPLVERFLIVTTHADVNYFLEGARHIPSGTEVACFLVGAGDHPETYHFLILKLSGTSEASSWSCPTYKRIGLVQIQGPPHSNRTRPSFITSWVKDHGEDCTIRVI